MPFQGWPSSTSLPMNQLKQQQHHYHYAPMTMAINYPKQSAFALMPPLFVVDHQVPSKLNHSHLHHPVNPTLKLRRCVALFFHLIDKTSIGEFLQHDKHFRHADKYLLAMVLVYFWRAKLREHHYTKDSFYLALWLAHDSVEEDLPAKYGLLPWALQSDDGRPSMDLKNDFKRFLSKKNDLWTRMGFRARVTKEECDEIMLVQPNHWIWQRERADDYNKKMAMSNRRPKVASSSSSSSSSGSCSSTSSASSMEETNSLNNPGGQTVLFHVSMDIEEEEEDGSV